MATVSHEFRDALTTTAEDSKQSPTNRPYDPCRIFLSEIPHGITDEVLTYFIDSRTQKEEEPAIIRGDAPGTAMVTYPTKIAGIIIENRFVCCSVSSLI